jgi:hypothetical protein
MTLLLVSILAAIILCCPLLRRAVFATVQIVGAAILVVALLIGITAARTEPALTEVEQATAFYATLAAAHMECGGQVPPKTKQRIEAMSTSHLASTMGKWAVELQKDRERLGNKAWCAGIAKAWMEAAQQLIEWSKEGAK